MSSDDCLPHDASRIRRSRVATRLHLVVNAPLGREPGYATPPERGSGEAVGQAKPIEAIGRAPFSAEGRVQRMEEREPRSPVAPIGDPCRAVVVGGPEASPSAISSARKPDSLIGERINAAARPILEAFARRQGVSSIRLLRAIGSPTPLTHPVVARELGGALHSEAMRSAVAANADPALVPLEVRAGLARLMAQDLSARPPSAVKETFPDWDKPLVPAGQHHPAWHTKDAAAWLKNFPPVRHLPQPLDTWDDATAALWLNDRGSIATACQDGGADGVVVAIDASNPWKPSLEVLHTLDELELEELAYRVFVERLRREMMPCHVSERRIRVRDALLHVTFGYQTLKDARRRVFEHDLKRIRHFDRVFGTNREWLYDLCCRIIDSYAWPSGFAEPELWSEFPDLDDTQR